MFSPDQLLNMMMNNPMAKQNPIANNVIKNAERGDFRKVENIGRNIAKEKGMDFDAEFAKFKSKFGVR